MIPKSLVLWVTTDCNLNCKYCYADAGKIQDYMSFETAKKAIDSMEDFPLKIQFAGGEPLLGLDLIEKVCIYVEDRKSTSLHIQTNGTLIDDRFIALVKKYKIKLGLSMDGVPKINESQRGNTRELIQGIYKLKENNIYVNINSVVTKENVEHLVKLYDLLLVMGNVRGMALDLLRNTGRAKENDDICLIPEEKQIKDIINKLNQHSKEMGEKFGRKIIIREIEEAKYRLQNKSSIEAYCYASIGRSYIVQPSGDIYPCGSLVGDKNYRIGHVDNKEEWKMVCLKRPQNNKCKICEYRQSCAGVCPSRMISSDNFPIDCSIKYNSFKIAESEINI